MQSLLQNIVSDYANAPRGHCGASAESSWPEGQPDLVLRRKSSVKHRPCTVKRVSACTPTTATVPATMPMTTAAPLPLNLDSVLGEQRSELAVLLRVAQVRGSEPALAQDRPGL